MVSIWVRTTGFRGIGLVVEEPHVVAYPVTAVLEGAPMLRRMPLGWLIPLTVVVLLLAGCGDAADEAVATTLAPVTTTLPSTTTAAPETTTTTGSEAAFTETEGFTYLTIEGEKYEGDMYVPEGEGPWPVVIMFHGDASAGKDDSYTTVVAEAAAAAGIRVFVPNWLTGVTQITPETFDFFHAAANCAVAYAQQDSDDAMPVVVYGFSAGVGPASEAALDPTTEAIPGCVAENPPAPITGAVFGDGEYFAHSTIFDGAFAADLEAMQAKVANTVNPSHWPPDMKTRFFLWVADNGTAPRTFDDPWDETGWLAQRDPDGSIRDDLNTLGQLDDGVISFIDEGEFMALRLEEAGIEVTLDNYPGGHTTKDKVSELVAYLLDAAAIN
jgi:acetyl esterase/lipase